MVFDVFISMVAFCLIINMAIDFYAHTEKRRKEKFHKIAQQKIYVGSKQDVERLRNWRDDNE